MSSPRTTPPSGRTGLKELPKREGDDAVATPSTAIAPIQREVDCIQSVPVDPAAPVERELPALPGGPGKPGLARRKD